MYYQDFVSTLCAQEASFWPAFGHLLASFWPAFGQLLASFWPVFGQILVKKAFKIMVKNDDKNDDKNMKKT